jgi:hypothetical protein
MLSLWTLCKYISESNWLSQILYSYDNPCSLFDSDPQGLTEFVANLYTDNYFYESLYRGLTDNGMLIAQLGSARAINDPPEDNSVDRFRLKYIEGLAEAGFKATREYTEVR